MDELRQMQLMLTDILKVFHDFCEKHSLRYYALYGTALGAARHQGFIPWDDDIDVGMPRPDYERLIKIFNQENDNKRYVLESPNSPDPCFLYTYSKLYDTHTTLIENVKHPLKRGIYLDIFPIDGAGTSKNDSLKRIRRIRKMVFLRDMRMIKISRERAFYKNMCLAFFQSIPNFILNEKKIGRKIDALCKTIEYESSDYVAYFASHLQGEKEIIPKVLLGKPVLCPFENIRICCPQDTDAYLTCIYGDWRTPPPKEKQITHHSHYLDLNNSYLNE